MTTVRLLRPISEDEMIAVFLRSELDSGRYGEKLHAFLARDGRDERVLREADLADKHENAYRRQLLEEHRAYKRRDGLFGGFPREVDWFRAVLGREEALDILYIDWDWWLRISEGSRRPRDAARRIRAGDVAGVTPEQHAPFTEMPQPELIAVTTPAHTPLILLEGHVRLTAYALFPDRVPDELEILLGVSEEMTGWSCF
jgi:hypothetical protein